jgi:hypothetical protein
MQPRFRRHAVVAAATLTLGLAACSSSNTTGPSGPTAAQLATHFDSIYSALLAQGTSLDSEFAGFVAFGGEAPAAFGAQQASFTVTTQSGTQTWKGLTYEEAFTGSGGDSSFITFLYSDLTLDELMIAETDYPTSGQPGGEGLVLLNFQTGGFDSTYTGSASVTSTGTTACSLQTGLAADSLINVEFTGGSCQPATFQVSFQMTFPTADGAGTLSSVSVSNAAFDGVRLYQAAAASHVAHTPSRLAALGMALRDRGLPLRWSK